MNVYLRNVLGTFKSHLSYGLVLIIVIVLFNDALALNGSHVCTVKQKYNVTKRVKYRAPMSVRTYEWCFAVPPRCSRWTTEMKDMTRLETEERTAEVAVCCPGYKMKDIACVPICPNGRRGSACTEECPDNKWGPNCVNECSKCFHGSCSPITGECQCEGGWKGESCEIRMPVTTSTTVKELLTSKITPTITPTTLFSSSSEATTETFSSTTETLSTPASRATTLLTTELTNTPLPISTKSSIITLPPVAEVTKPFTKEVTVTSTENHFETNYPYPTEQYTKRVKETTNTPVTTQPVTEVRKIQTSIRPEFITKTTQQTTKFRPKEIWIKPAQKGESLIDKVKVHEIHQRPKTTNVVSTSPVTTPRTIIVSIIPTSMTYSTFKKISLTTTALDTHNVSKPSNIGLRKFSLTHSTSTPMSLNTKELFSTTQRRNKFTSTSVNPLLLKNITRAQSYTASVTGSAHSTTITSRTTNSMTRDVNKKTLANNTLTTKHPNNSRTRNPTSIQISTVTETIVSTAQQITKSSTFMSKSSARTSPHPTMSNQTIAIERNTSTRKAQTQQSSLIKNINKNLTLANTSKWTTERVTTLEDELFHILTEPEHITAVVGEKNEDRNSVDLVSVVSIAGGVMMAVITVAVLIVMIDRCRRPMYQEVRKENDIQMKVVIGNEMPPAYSKSIFHTPLPDPPTSEKCVYQPISTLDRNLKQFMRPVIVQGISPIMIENFRDIFECHYDHLPRRNYSNAQVEPRFVSAPSSGAPINPHQTIDESTFEALKCEAKFDVIDNTASEPLYAEIPAWRPPSEHAIAVVNLNGEAVTEL